jgi:Co/Zn/Cd efflux system component
MADDCCKNKGDTCCAPPPLVLPAKTSAPREVADTCCSGGVPVFDGMNQRYKRILWTVIAINGAMFLTEMVAGQLAGSQALRADALDFLGDTITYGLSLAVIGASLRTRASAALFKGLSLSLMGLWVFGSTVYQTLILGVPSAEVMGVVGFLALAANLASVVLLVPYKDGDANVRSVWLCSRNDAIGNTAVMVAALGVWGTSTAWPDLLVAAIMAGVFLTSSVQILRHAWAEYREESSQRPSPNETIIHGKQ